MGKNSVISLYDYDEYGKLVKADNGKYGLVHANCAIQGTNWTYMPYRNNPGAFARMMLNQSIYYNSASLRSILWWN